MNIPTCAHMLLWSLRDCEVLRIAADNEGAKWLGLRSYINWVWVGDRLDVRLTDEGKALAARTRFEPKVTRRYG